MSMIKIIPPRAWADFDHLDQLTQVKVAHDGLRGTDFAQFVKVASHPLATWVRANPPKPGEVYVHSHIFSVTDTGGGNRNGDEYSRKMAREDLKSYVTHGRAYVDHKNRDPDKAMGVVKQAYLNEEMGRAELITALNASKEAAERNRGVTADRTLQKIASGDDVAVSQSCKVPYDVCNACGNRAPNRAHYCKAAMCKYGGCADNLGRVFDDGHHLCVDNPKCQFFDWSDVSNTRGADRTAFITGKVANAHKVVGGAELAEMLNLVPPEHLVDPVVRGGLAALRKMACSRTTATSPGWDHVVATRAKVANVRPEVPVFQGSDAERHHQVAELGHRGVVLPPDIWLSATTGAPVEKCAAAFAGGIDVDRDLLNRNDCHDLIAAHALSEPSTPYSAHWLAPTAKAHGLESQLAMLAPVKSASSEACPPAVRAEAKARYLAYQAGVLRVNENSVNFPLLLTDCLRDNS